MEIEGEIYLVRMKIAQGWSSWSVATKDSLHMFVPDYYEVYRVMRLELQTVTLSVSHNGEAAPINTNTSTEV